MSDKPNLGGYEFNAELVRIRNATNTIRDSLTQLLEGNPGPQTIAALVARMAIQITIIFEAIGNLQKIGNEAKKDRTKQE